MVTLVKVCKAKKVEVSEARVFPQFFSFPWALGDREKGKTFSGVSFEAYRNQCVPVTSQLDKTSFVFSETPVQKTLLSTWNMSTCPGLAQVPPGRDTRDEGSGD